MRGAAFAAGALLAAAGTAAAAPPQPIGPPAVLDENLAARVTVAPPAAAARPTTVRLTLRAPVLCGKPLARAVAITFPVPETVPARIARSAVRVVGLRVRSAAVDGHTVSLALAPAPAKGATCHSITLGRLQITFTASAGLGNPADAGTYTVTATRGTAQYQAQFRVES